MIPLQVFTIDDEFPDLTRRELPRCTRAGHQAAGEEYVRSVLPDHFAVGVQKQFGYAPRTVKYLRRKQRLFASGAMIQGRRVIAGANQDLVLTGSLREQVLSSAARNIRAYPSRVTITMRVDRQSTPYFTLRPRSKNTSRIAREVLSDSPASIRKLGETFDRGFERELAELRRSRRLRKTSKVA